MTRALLAAAAGWTLAALAGFPPGWLILTIAFTYITTKDQ